MSESGYETPLTSPAAPRTAATAPPAISKTVPSDKVNGGPETPKDSEGGAGGLTAGAATVAVPGQRRRRARTDGTPAARRKPQKKKKAAVEIALAEDVREIKYKC